MRVHSSSSGRRKGRADALYSSRGLQAIISEVPQPPKRGRPNQIMDQKMKEEMNGLVRGLSRKEELAHAIVEAKKKIERKEEEEERGRGRRKRLRRRRI